MHFGKVVKTLPDTNQTLNDIANQKLKINQIKTGEIPRGQ